MRCALSSTGTSAARPGSRSTSRRERAGAQLRRRPRRAPEGVWAVIEEVFA